MRYPDGGGLTAYGRSRREMVRRQAAGMYEQGMDPVQVAGLLRVSTKPACRWRRAWKSGGDAALASKGPGGSAWLTIIPLPFYAPGLNPVEGAWPSMKSGLGNLSATTLDQLAAAVRNRLRRIQRQPELVTALLGQACLTLEAQPP